MTNRPDHQCDLTVSAAVPKCRIAELAKEAREAGIPFEEFFRQKMENLLAPFGVSGVSAEVSPTPQVVTQAAEDYADLCAMGAACHRQPGADFVKTLREHEGVKTVPRDPPGTFRVVVNQ